MELRHGRLESLHRCPFKLEPFPQQLTSGQKQFVPEIIAWLDCIVYRGVLPVAMNKVTATSVSGNAKRQSERKPSDIGLLQTILASILMRDYVIQRFKGKMLPAMVKIYQDVLSYESKFPAPKVIQQRQAYGITDDSGDDNVAWLSNLNEANTMCRDLLTGLYEGEHSEPLKEGINEAGTTDPMRIIEAVQFIKDKIKAVDQAYVELARSTAAASDIVVNPTALADAPPTAAASASHMLSDQLFFEQAEAQTPEASLDPEARKAQQQAAVKGKAQARRKACQAFLVLKPAEPLNSIVRGIENHALWQQSLTWKWGDKCVVILVDPSCGPDGPYPTKAPPLEAQLQNAGFKPRLEAALELANRHPSCVVVIPDGHRFCNRRHIDGLVGKKIAALKVKFNERMLCTTYASGQFRQRARGVASDPDWETSSWHSRQDFFELKTKTMMDALGGRQTSSRCVEKMKMMPADEVPGISLEVKQRIWNGFAVSSDQLKVGTPAYRKNVKSQWRNKIALDYFQRHEAWLQQICENVGCGLLVVMFTGFGAASFSACGVKSADQPDAKVPVLSLVNNAEHQHYVESVLDTHYLRAMQTQGHALHNQLIADQVQEAFPSLMAVTALSDNKVTGNDADELEDEEQLEDPEQLEDEEGTQN